MFCDPNKCERPSPQRWMWSGSNSSAAQYSLGQNDININIQYAKYYVWVSEGSPPSNFRYTEFFTFIHIIPTSPSHLSPLTSLIALDLSSCRLCVLALAVFCFSDEKVSLKPHSVTDSGHKWCLDLNCHLLCHCFFSTPLYRTPETQGEVQNQPLKFFKQPATLTWVIFLKYNCNYIISFLKFFQWFF